MNYYRRFPGDYIRDTLRLTFLEDAAYSRLLDHLYAVEQPIQDLSEAFRITRARTKREKKATENVLTWYFVFTDEGYTNKRYEEELNHAKSRRNAAIENGKMGGRPKPAGLAVANPRESSPDTRVPESEADRFSPNPTLMQKLGISLSLWVDFKNMREKIKRPLVSGGEDYILTELLDFQSRGENPVAVISQAIRTSSYILYPVKKEKENGKLDPKKRTERNLRNAGLPN